MRTLSPSVSSRFASSATRRTSSAATLSFSAIKQHYKWPDGEASVRAHFFQRLAERIFPPRESHIEPRLQFGVAQHRILRPFRRRGILRVRNAHHLGPFPTLRIARLVKHLLRKAAPARLTRAGHVINSGCLTV